MAEIQTVRTAELIVFYPGVEKLLDMYVGQLREGLQRLQGHVTFPIPPQEKSGHAWKSFAQSPYALMAFAGDIPGIFCTGGQQALETNRIFAACLMPVSLTGFWKIRSTKSCGRSSLHNACIDCHFACSAESLLHCKACVSQNCSIARDSSYQVDVSLHVTLEIKFPIKRRLRHIHMGF